MKRQWQDTEVQKPEFQEDIMSQSLVTTRHCRRRTTRPACTGVARSASSQNMLLSLLKSKRQSISTVCSKDNLQNCLAKLPARRALLVKHCSSFLRLAWIIPYTAWVLLPRG